MVVAMEHRSCRQVAEEMLAEAQVPHSFRRAAAAGSIIRNIVVALLMVIVRRQTALVARRAEIHFRVAGQARSSRSIARAEIWPAIAGTQAALVIAVAEPVVD